MSNNSSSANRLIKEKSPYLLQHAYNPVFWYPWGEEAFQKAQQEHKPVLLSIGYSTCHWCHVMAHESFENEEIAKFINEHFIAIKVDREERPDIDHIYMTAVTAMTGQGGWPLTAFLMPDGKPFYGGTYFPPFPKWGSVGFQDLLASIASSWSSNYQEILNSSESITQSLQQQTPRAERADELGVSLLEKAFAQMNRSFDPSYGGFGKSPKFPMGHNLSFLLRMYKRTGNTQILEMVEHTLTQMARGGICDQLGGGFHRYSTDQQWHVPHFEKMLYDQALLSRAYLEAYQVTGDGRYAQWARAIFDFVLKEMRHPQGGFYSAYDADSLEEGSPHAVEGAFYVFTYEQIMSTLGEEHGTIFNYCYGVGPQGNAAFDPHGEFRGKNILYVAHDSAEAAQFFAKEETAIEIVLKEAKAKLLDLRQKRKRPHLDDKILTDWNGLMIASLAFGSRVLGDETYKKAAQQAADFILGSMTYDGRLWHRWREEEAGITATLEDYSFFIYGLLEVYEAGFNDEYLKQAHDFARGMIQLFADESGGFFMTAHDAERLIIRPKEAYDGALPSGNAVAALILLRLSVMLSEEKYAIKAQGIFKYFAQSLEEHGSAHTFLLSALDFNLSSQWCLSFEGKWPEADIAKMIKVVYKYFIPNKVLVYRSTQTHGKVSICKKGLCLPPVKNPEDLDHQIIKEINS